VLLLLLLSRQLLMLLLPMGLSWLLLLLHLHLLCSCEVGAVTCVLQQTCAVQIKQQWLRIGVTAAATRAADVPAHKNACCHHITCRPAQHTR
jgi:hypothetical protein